MNIIFTHIGLIRNDNMKRSPRKISRENFRYLKLFGVVIGAILFYAIINNFGAVKSVFDSTMGVGKSLLRIFLPITLGLCLAFVFNLPLKFFEDVVFGKLTRRNGKVWSKIKRAVCLVLSFLLILSVLTLVTYFILPEFVRVCTGFLLSLPEHIEELNATIKYYAETFNLPINFSLDIDVWATISAKALDYIKDTDGTITTDKITSLITSVYGVILDVVLGFVLSIYILASKEKLGKLAKSFLYAAFSRKRARSIISLITLSNKAFTGFVSGQCLEVLIIGTLCFIGMLIFRFPYAIMISCIIAITAFIPVFGPFVGTTIGALIIFLDSPIKAIWFVIYILVLQQIESNVIYPKIMGDQVGLPGMWVLAAVTIGGGLFGVPGIIISVPLCSVLYTLINRWIVMRLEKKNICHQSMSPDASEPGFIVDENMTNTAINNIIDEALDTLENPTPVVNSTEEATEVAEEAPAVEEEAPAVEEEAPAVEEDAPVVEEEEKTTEE